MYLSSHPPSISALEGSRAISERMEGRGWQCKVGSNSPSPSPASHCRKGSLCREKRLLKDTGIHQGLDNLTIVLNWGCVLCPQVTKGCLSPESGQKSHGTAQVVIQWHFKAKLKVFSHSSLWVLIAQHACYTCMRFLKMFLSYKYFFLQPAHPT